MAHTSETLRDAFHYLYPNELPFLKSLPGMIEHSPCVVVNIGAGAGTSGLAFMESRRDIILHTVDIQDASSPFGCLQAEREVLEAAGYGHLRNIYWYQYHSDSKELAKRWFLTIDILFIDGDHSYDGCAGDIRLWTGRVRKGGLIAVHDYRKGDLEANSDGPHPMAWPGVDRAVDELLVPYYKKIGHIDSLIVFRK